MKTIYQEIKDYCGREPKCRERSLHQRGMVNLLLKKYPELAIVEKEMLINFAKDFESYTRAWRLLLQDEPSMRGNDYNLKSALEVNKKVELGYISPLFKV